MFQDEILRKAVQRFKGKNWKKIGMNSATNEFFCQFQETNDGLCYTSVIQYSPFCLHRLTKCCVVCQIFVCFSFSFS